MSNIEKLTGIGILFVCITWCGIKVGEFYYKVNLPPPQEITQYKSSEPKQGEAKKAIRQVDGVVPWVLELEALSITKPEKFRHASNGSLWAYGDTGIWIASGVDYVEIWGRGEIQLTDLEKTILYDAYTEWNKDRAELVKSNFKIE